MLLKLVCTGSFSVVFSLFSHFTQLWIVMMKVDLTAYVEKHEFCFDAVLDEHVTNDQVISSSVVNLC